MTTNQTSEAVSRIQESGTIEFADWVLTCTAILDKYQKMNQALSDLIEQKWDINGTGDWYLGKDLEAAYDKAESAIAYDPLAA